MEMQQVRDTIEQIAKVSREQGVLVHGALFSLIERIDAENGTSSTPHTSNEPAADAEPARLADERGADNQAALDAAGVTDAAAPLAPAE